MGVAVLTLVAMDTAQIRNFCIIAHIDHGKSTLADRLLELTGTVNPEDMTNQFLDQMDLERERGITIKGKVVRMVYGSSNGDTYYLNLIDTPGHVDFGYEVSRALAACEGAILVVDAAQGIQAQTLANAYLAASNNLTLIPVVNKIDLAVADPERVATELVDALGFSREEIIYASAKVGSGVHEILEAVVNRVDSPNGGSIEPLRALIFDSAYDRYKGVVAHVRVMHGKVESGNRLRMLGTNSTAEAVEVGVFRPSMESTGQLTTGEVGYVATGLKNVRECRVGDTMALAGSTGIFPLPGYEPLKLMVFAGLYPAEGESYQPLRDALEKLQLNDPALGYEPESSPALGFGFRCGFLGPLHLEIVQERLEREYGLNLIATTPSVAYQVLLEDNREVEVVNLSLMPTPGQVKEIREPWLNGTIVTPDRYIGPLMELMTGRRGVYRRMEYLTAATPAEDTTNPVYDARVLIEFDLPMAELLAEFYEQVKSRSQGYASLDYTLSGYHAGPLVKLDVLLNGKIVDALSLIVHRDKAYETGKGFTHRLSEVIPRQLFEVAIQAAIGGRIIARETIKPLRKNVLAKCYGGDVTRKKKLLERQAEGKKRLKKVGQVEVPQEAFFALLKMDKTS